MHHWARRWLAEQWPGEWQPRTRSSSVEALARFTWLAVKPKADVPDDLRRYLADTLAPDAVHVPEMERWLDRNCLTLADLDREAVAEIAPGSASGSNPSRASLRRVHSRPSLVMSMKSTAMPTSVVSRRSGG